MIKRQLMWQFISFAHQNASHKCSAFVLVSYNQPLPDDRDAPTFLVLVRESPPREVDVNGDEETASPCVVVVVGHSLTRFLYDGSRPRHLLPVESHLQQQERHAA